MDDEEERIEEDADEGTWISVLLAAAFRAAALLWRRHADRIRPSS